MKYGEVLDLKTEALPYIQSKEIADKFKASLLRNGDVVIADTAEDETVGKCTEIANLGTFEVLAGLHTIPLRPKQKYAVGYLGYYMNSYSFHDTLLPLMQGTKVTSISKSALQGTTISYPTDYSEQQQIGTYFRNLDNLITLHQRVALVCCKYPTLIFYNSVSISMLHKNKWKEKRFTAIKKYISCYI